MKMLNDASSAAQEESDDGWIEEDPLEGYEKDSKEESYHYALDTKEDNTAINLRADSSVSDMEDVSEEDLLEKMRIQSEQYKAEIAKMQKSREDYENAKRELKKDSKNHRGFFELDLKKSNLEGNTILERLGYDKDAKNKPYEERHPVETYFEKKVTDSRVRIGIYIGLIVLGIVIMILNHTVF